MGKKCHYGKWKAQRNKSLVNIAKSLCKIKPMQVHFHWVKAHQGNEGNERADHLADRGRKSLHRQGTTAQSPPEEDTTTPIREDAFTAVLQEAARQTFSNESRRRRTPWVTDHTLDLLQEARTAEAQGDHDAKHKRNRAKRSARKDRVQWVHQQLLEDPSAEHSPLWKTIKRHKAGFRGKKSHLVVDNKPVSWSKTHQAFRDHLQNKQWAPQEQSSNNLHILKARRNLRDAAPDETPFTIEDLQTALVKLKKRKAPGPNHTANELFMLLDDDNQRLLLEFYNKI